MFSTEIIKNYIEEKKHDFIFDVRHRPSDDVILLYVPQEKIIEKSKKGFTSSRQLEFIKKKIEAEYEMPVEVVVTQSEDHFELEAGIFQILNRKFDDRVLALYLSFSGHKKVNVWIDIEGLNKDILQSIEKHLCNILDEANILVNVISWASTEPELPTLASILREIKIYQPIDLDGLLKLLHKNFYSIPDKWLNRKLDQLRKRGFLRREKNGCYVLTALAVASVPAGTRYTSSDIERALALGKRKW